MNKITFYNRIPDMECLAGDTLDTMEIEVTGLENLTSPSMKVVVSKKGKENNIVVQKSCSLNGEGTGFTVTIDSDDTERLNGVYWVDFILTANSVHYKKLRGILVVYPQYKGGT